MPFKASRPFTGRFFMGLIPVVFLLFRGSPLCAQKSVIRTFSAQDLTKVHIDAGRIFEVVLESDDSEDLRVEVEIEGEYQNEMTLGAKKEGATLFLKGVFLPSFEDPNDKLSAHKVLSVRLTLVIPQHLNAEVSGMSTRVVAKGYFEDLGIRTAKGPVILTRPTGYVHVKTGRGAIRAAKVSGFVTASSSYGEVFKGEVPQGRSAVVLESVSGNIYINKEE